MRVRHHVIPSPSSSPSPSALTERSGLWCGWGPKSFPDSLSRRTIFGPIPPHTHCPLPPPRTFCRPPAIFRLFTLHLHPNPLPAPVSSRFLSHQPCSLPLVSHVPLTQLFFASAPCRHTIPTCAPCPGSARYAPTPRVHLPRHTTLGMERSPAWSSTAQPRPTSDHRHHPACDDSLRTDQPAMRALTSVAHDCRCGQSTLTARARPPVVGSVLAAGLGTHGGGTAVPRPVCGAAQ